MGDNYLRLGVHRRLGVVALDEAVLGLHDARFDYAFLFGRGAKTCQSDQWEELMTDAFGPGEGDGFSRRRVLQLGAGVAGATLIPGLLGHGARAYAEDKPPLGTWPGGSQGDSVTIGATVPRTGAYAAQGEDELKGMQLAVEHLNEGNDLIKQIAPKVTKGVLGKEVKLVVADSAAKPNNAVQEQQTFIAENKIILMTGSTSSAVAVALNKLAQREKVLYVTGISGSNDTTGKDCVRYGFRQNFYAETAANAIGPVLVKAYGKNKKAAFMTPDYTYGHTVTKSVNDYLTLQCGWTQVSNQVSPLGTEDFSQYLTNIANSGAEVIINVNWGRDAVLSVQQARQFGLTPDMKMVIPFEVPFLAKEVGPELTEGVFSATDFWWTLEDRFPLAKMFVDAFQKKYDYRPEWGAENAYMQFAIWGRMVSEAGSFYPPDVIKQYEKGETFPSIVGDVRFRAQDHQLIRPVIIVRGKAPKDMKNSEDYWEVLEVVPGQPLMQKPDAFGCSLGSYT
jgi:branched-chain amino acid transport system substrate-binding protein